MIVLGIDPGTAETGAGVIKKNGKIADHLFHTCIKTNNTKSPEKRLFFIHQEIIKIIKKYKPKIVVVESLFFFNNAKSISAVGQAIGAIMIAAASQNLEVRLYSPLKIKKILTDYGRASKEELQTAVQKILRKKDVLKPTHAADALAVALCHLKVEKLI